MASGFRVRPKPLLAGVLTSLAGALFLLFFADGLLERMRESFFDRQSQWISAPVDERLVVVDIDRKSFQNSSEGEWTRAQTAALVARIGAAHPLAIAFDFVFSDDCDPSERANGELAAAIADVPTVLGFLIGENAEALPKPVPPLALQRPVSIPDLWFIDGTESSCPLFQDRATSAAAAFLVGDEDALVRRIQAYTIVDNAAYPALGVEIARLAANVRTPVLGGEQAWLRQDSRVIRLDEDGSLRFVASDAAAMGARTLSAADVLAGQLDVKRLSGKVVLIGSSLPNLGGLRATASMPLEPSVQIHADVASGILTGFIPMRPRTLIPLEAAFALLAGFGIAISCIRLRPVISAGLVAGALALMFAAFNYLYSRTGLLVDTVGIALVLVAVGLVTSLSQFARVRRAEATARQRFGQYLPQSVVARYIDNPDMERVGGEERQVTALFTDIEGFSTLSQKIGRHELVHLLDVYFAEVNAVVARHGGMVDKVVGDAVHGLFNAPEDLEGHVDKAIACAVEILALTEEMRSRPAFSAQAFGRTRIGIETGMTLLGEVGAGGKLDYTAYGNAINLASRLQEANKFLGTAICIGPAAAAETTWPLRPLGTHEIRGFGAIELFTIA
ncbi:CHASE2 domain-containing protein [Sinorhizobium sp. BG8]|uniref:CHASE2 domain-containing protein n=1 Tax=Sinorhizobium sp. BG8 TaxID=2613773 RepID=UPI00193E7A97|nr:CHASE2 domain-containing protein [Sinorhizobium sp. BG8]QRM54076.1 CHASE2 domain-containing protein [Sinorhizobium sp. BG8]